MIDMCDPALMFTIPRLAIISGLVLYQDGPLNPDNKPDAMSDMFRPFQTLLSKIKQLLLTLSRQEFSRLERALCSNDETPHGDQAQASLDTSPAVNNKQNCDNEKLSSKQNQPVQESVQTHQSQSLTSSQTLVSNMIVSTISSSSTMPEELLPDTPYQQLTHPVMTDLPASTVTPPSVAGETDRENDLRETVSVTVHCDVTQSEWLDGVRELESVIDDLQKLDQNNTESTASAREAVSPVSAEIYEDAQSYLSPSTSVNDFKDPVKKTCHNEPTTSRTIDQSETEQAIETDQSPSSVDKISAMTQTEDQLKVEEDCLDQSKYSTDSLLQSTSFQVDDDDEPLPISSDHFQHERSLAVNNEGTRLVSERGRERSRSLSRCSSECDSVCDSDDSSSYSSDCNDHTEVLLAIRAAQLANHKGIRSRFKNSAELNHKLFVCVAGVADQLQTNFAADLRHILRTVFTMHSTDDPEPAPSGKHSSSSARFQLRDRKSVV